MSKQVKRERNPDACCGTCPYWARWVNSRTNEPMSTGDCQRHAPTTNDDAPTRLVQQWCGEHPDFWIERKDGK